MSINTGIVWLVAGIVFLGGGYLLFMSNSAPTTVRETDEEKMMEKGDESAMQKEGATMETSSEGGSASGGMKKDEGMMSQKGSYESYSPDKLALAKEGKVVLYFHADWCPICRPLDVELRAATIPQGVHILKVNYDTAGDLKKTYGVTYQHTFVQVDAAGKLITKWGDTFTAADVFAKVQ